MLRRRYAPVANMPSPKLRDIFPNEITVLTSEVLKKLANNRETSMYEPKIKAMIDELGALSAIAQYLKHPITTYEKLLESNHKLYLIIDYINEDSEGAVIGYLKIGQKHLFVTDGSEPAWPANVQCVLDFFIKEEYQRHGWGKHVFEYALVHQDNIDAQHMAYDRPSEKLTNFLAKHYQLKDAVEQPNRYVMYGNYFINNSKKYSQGRCIPNSQLNSGSSEFFMRRY